MNSAFNIKNDSMTIRKTNSDRITKPVRSKIGKGITNVVSCPSV